MFTSEVVFSKSQPPERVIFCGSKDTSKTQVLIAGSSYVTNGPLGTIVTPNWWDIKKLDTTTSDLQAVLIFKDPIAFAFLCDNRQSAQVVLTSTEPFTVTARFTP